MCSLSVIAHLMSKMEIIQYIRPFETKLKGTCCLDKTFFFHSWGVRGWSSLKLKHLICIHIIPHALRKSKYLGQLYDNCLMPDRVAQSVALPTQEPKMPGSIPVRPHTFVLPQLQLIQEGQLSVTDETMCTQY